MTLAQLRTICLDWLDDPSGTYFTQSVLNTRLNLALQELQKRLISANKEWFLDCVKTNTVANQQAYALPTDFLEIIRLEWYEVGTSGTTMPNKIEAMTPNQRDLMGSALGDPAYYSMAKTNIMLWPIPNRIVEVHLEYVPLITQLVNDSDTPDIQSNFHEYVAILATRDCLLKDGRPLAPIQSKLEQYEILMKQQAVQRQADGPRMVVQTQGNDWTW